MPNNTIANSNGSSIIPVRAYDNGNGDGTYSMMVAVSGAKGTPTGSTAAPTGSAAQLIAANTARKTLIIVNNSTVVVYLGNANTVTVANGLPLAIGATFNDDMTTSAWWGITAGTTGDIRMIEVA